MSNILIVDDEEKLSRRVWPERRTRVNGDTKGNTPRQEVTTWRDFASRAPEHVLGDVVVLNLEAPGAPTLQEAVRLRERQPELGFVYVVDIAHNVPERMLAALSQPGVTWVSSKASDQELRLRLRGLVDSIKHSRASRPSKSMAQPRAGDAVRAPGAQEQSPWARLTPELHNPDSGRLDAACTADWFGMPLKTLAGLLGRGYATVHKTPDAAALQDKLKVFLRLASALSHLAGSHEGARIWLNTPNSDLEDSQTPMSAIELGEQEIIAELLEDALAGQPG